MYIDHYEYVIKLPLKFLSQWLTIRAPISSQLHVNSYEALYTDFLIRAWH
jgi:hypothetical protein